MLSVCLAVDNRVGKRRVFMRSPVSPPTHHYFHCSTPVRRVRWVGFSVIKRISGGSVQQKTACDLHPWIIRHSSLDK